MAQGRVCGKLGQKQTYAPRFGLPSLSRNTLGDCNTHTGHAEKEKKTGSHGTERAASNPANSSPS